MLYLLVVAVIALGAGLWYVRSQRGAGDDDAGKSDTEALRAVVEQELGRLARDEGFDRRIVGLDGLCGVALHPDARRVMIVAPENPGAPVDPEAPIELFVRVYPASDVLAVERRDHDILRVEDDIPELRVRALELHVFVDDLERPSHVLTLLDRSAKWGSKRHREASAVASTWEGLLRIATRRGTAPRSVVLERGNERGASRAAPPRPPERIPERTPERVPERTPEPSGDAAPPPLPILEPRATARTVEPPIDEAEAARREAARRRLLDRARSR